METLLGILAKTIISLLINDLAQQPRLAALRDKISGESPQRLALQYALAKTYGAFAEKYPDLAHAFFDEHFLKQPEVAAELAKLLTPDGMADPATLIQLWQGQFPKPIEIELADTVDFFIQTLNSEIKNQPDLKPFVDSRAFDQLYQIAESGEQQVVEQRIGNVKLDSIDERLATIAESTAAQPTQLHIHSQGGPVIVGDVDVSGNFNGGDKSYNDEDMVIVENSSTQTTTPHSNVSLNPFNCYGCITNPQLFFGRTQIVRELQQALANGNDTALIGGSESGKSSLLNYLYHTHQSWLPSHKVILIDLQGVVDEIHFYNKILNKLKPLGNVQQSHREAKQTFEQAIHGQQVLLMLDEVERLIYKDFTPGLQFILRSLCQKEQTLTLLAACEHPVEDIFPSFEGTSPLHNILQKKLLPNFTHDETKAFIRHRLTTTGIHFDEQELGQLWHTTQGHPGRVQREAERLFDCKRGKL